MWIEARWAPAIAVRATVIMSQAPIPSMPIASPLKTEVRAKATQLAVPTSPLARSRRSSETRSVTVVDRATARRLPATEPARTSMMNTQVRGCRSDGSESSGAIR